MIVFFLLLIFNSFLYAQQPHLQEKNIKHNPWELRIYRPINAGSMNDVRCFLRLEDSEGNDVTKTAIRKAYYKHAGSPDKNYSYKNKIYLTGGTILYLNLKSGKYKISVYTPPEYQYPYSKKSSGSDWSSNIFEYDTENPLKVIFVYPTANENSFYNGGWIINYKSPEFYEFTKPEIIHEGTNK